MSTNEHVVRDERTVAVEHASYRWAYILLTYALLADVAFRGLVRGEAAWDLMALVIVSGLFCSAYQARQRILVHGWARKAALLACAAGAIGAVVALILQWTS